MKKKIYSTVFIMAIIAIVLFFINSFFTTQREYAKDIPVANKTIFWDCTNITDEELNISSIFPKYSLLPLENKSESLIGHIGKIEIFDNLLFILDEKYLARIFVFNANNGAFIRTIGKIGQGPGEYLSLNDFSIDQKNGNIYFLCEQNMIYTYSQEGIFLEKKELPFFASNMEYKNKRFYFRCDFRSTHHLVITDEDMNIISKHLETDLYKKADRKQIHHFQKRKNEITFHRFLDNRIYKINENGELHVAYQLGLGEDAIEMKDVSNLNSHEIKDQLKSKKTYYKYFTENDKYAFILFIKKGIPYISIFNKITNQSKTYEYKNLKNDFLDDEALILEYESYNDGFWGILSLETTDWLISKGKLKTNNSYEINPVLIHIE